MSAMLLLEEILDKLLEIACHDFHIMPLDNQGAKIFFRQGKATCFSRLIDQESWQRLIEFIKFTGHYDYSKSQEYQHLNIVYKKQSIRVAMTPSPTPYLTGRLHHHLNLSLSKEMSLFIDKWLEKRQLLLIAGPMKSGKTTLYYQILHHALGAQKTLMSFEDPIEQHFSALMQLPLTSSTSFEQIAPSLLRFDLDLVGLGEVRYLSSLSALALLSFSHIHTLTSFHTSDLTSLNQKFKMLSPQDYEHLQASLFGIILIKDLHAPPSLLEKKDVALSTMDL